MKMIVMGKNGAGKSTLLKIIAGKTNRQQIYAPKEAVVAYLPQHLWLLSYCYGGF
jgi:ATP-binding cassette subfamily F protein 3